MNGQKVELQGNVSEGLPFATLQQLSKWSFAKIQLYLVQFHEFVNQLDADLVGDEGFQLKLNQLIGATLNKGINRGIGTIIGGGLGSLSTLLALKIGGISRFIIIGISVFISGAVASYVRLIPIVKKRFDYGVLIFILTFNLVAVSASRGFQTIEIASDRLSMIGIGFAITLLTSLFIFPIWASDELHHSLISKFDSLALSIQVCLKEYFKLLDTSREPHASSNISSSKSVLHSKTADEMMANFAKWERWHGKFGVPYPWGKHLSLGELLRELAACIFSLEECVQPHRQPSPFLKLAVKEPCEAVGTLLSFTLRELGDGISNMRRSRPCELIIAMLRLTRLELSTATLAFHSRTPEIGNDTVGDGLPIASFMFILMEMVEKVEVLAKEVEELGDLAGFLHQ
ncbi:hypothetical protein ACLOJK_007997 [Asimina triloba]